MHEFHLQPVCVGVCISVCLKKNMGVNVHDLLLCVSVSVAVVCMGIDRSLASQRHYHTEFILDVSGTADSVMHREGDREEEPPVVCEDLAGCSHSCSRTDCVLVLPQKNVI